LATARWPGVAGKPTEALSALQVMQLEGYRFASAPLQRAADRFLLQCHTGLSYGDLMDFDLDWDVADKWLK